ncbi:MAG: UvrD-helicase domain-containing protein [Proteobacteria bacterium]|nr:UvrD-helicase domain-containing protein [Pseudomonadota bacterium]
MTTDLTDKKERLSALDTNCSHHVEAPAGSGKTLLLTMRFLKLLGEVNHPGEIIALTFTEKAAGEMRDRVIRVLNMAQNDETPENSLDETLLELADNAISRHHRLISADVLNIMTFHGFCLYMAKRAPLQAGIAPDCEIMDEEVQPVLMEEALRRVRDRLFSSPGRDIKRKAFENRLLYHNNNWNSISDELKEVIKTRDQFEDLIMEIRLHGITSFPSILNERLQIYIERCLNNLLENFLSSDLGAKWREFTDHLSGKGVETDNLPSSLPGTSWDELPSWQAIADRILTKDGRPRRQFGPKSGFYSNFKRTVWGELIENLPGDAAKALHETRDYPAKGDTIADIGALSDFIILAAEVIGEYEAICGKRHIIDFIGLEQSALRELDEENPSDLHLYLDHRIRHLLVDEFQDTSRNQWELIKRLCSGWMPGDGRTIFIVGDPKQSIYSFRKAEVRLFIEAKSGIPIPGQVKLPLDTHLLKTNFRSTEKLIKWVNSLFGNMVMLDPDTDADEVPFNPSVPAGDNGEETVISLNLFSDEDSDRAKDNEARWLAQKVKKTLDETGGNKSIAILLFTRNRIQRYLAALKEEHIPVQVQEGLSLAERPEVAHLMQTARFIARPHDDLAWASLLRSPWSWFDVKILQETAMQDAENWMEKIHLTAKIHPEMNPLLEAIDKTFLKAGREPLGKTVKEFWESLDGPRITACLYGMGGVANCRRFFEILEDAEQGIPQETLNRIEIILDSLYEPVDPTTSRSQVQMMTIHRAKGLEFDIVFLPFMDWRPLASGPKTPPPYLLERMPGAGEKHLIAMGRDRRTEEPTPTFRLLNKLRKERAWGEAKRTFYVAATRARHVLIMSGAAKTKDESISAPDKSILGWVMDWENVNGANPADIKNNTISITVNPATDIPSPEDGDTDLILPEPIPLAPERIPYTVKSPSSLKPDGLPHPGDYDAESRIRGIITHRILHTSIMGAKLPTEPAAIKSLCAEGLSADTAVYMAPGIIEEVVSTLSDPFIIELINKTNPVVRSEWAIEDTPKERHIRSGIIDLAVFDGNDWWIVDFKTSRPAKDEPPEEFMSREEELYRPQLEAYRSMLEKVESVGKSKIHTGIYLTALKQWREL